MKQNFSLQATVFAFLQLQLLKLGKRCVIDKSLSQGKSVSPSLKKAKQASGEKKRNTKNTQRLGAMKKDRLWP